MERGRVVSVREFVLAAGAALSLLTLPGCSQAQDISGAWAAIELSGNPVRGPTITLADGRVTGTGGCNRISGPATMTGADIKIGPLISTRMLCEGKMEIEAAFIAALEGAKSFDLVAETLTLKDASGAVAVIFSK